MFFFLFFVLLQYLQKAIKPFIDKGENKPLKQSIRNSFYGFSYICPYIPLNRITVKKINSITLGKKTNKKQKKHILM